MTPDVTVVGAGMAGILSGIKLTEAGLTDFTIYEKSKTRSRLVDELSAREIVMPRLYDWLVTG